MVISLVLAAVAYVREVIRRRADLAAKRDVEERQQADRIEWWHELCDVHPIPYAVFGSITNVYDRLRLDHCWGEKIVLQNLSDSPIHEVIVNTPGHLLIDVEFFNGGDLGPGVRRELHIAGFGTSLLDSQFMYPGNVSFGDRDGRRWQRNQSGELLPVPGGDSHIARQAAERRRAVLHDTLRAAGEDYARGTHQLLSFAEKVCEFEPPETYASKRLRTRWIERGDDLAFRMLQTLDPRDRDRAYAPQASASARLRA